VQNFAAKLTRITAQVLLIGGFVGGIAIYSYKTYLNVVEDAHELPKCYPLRWHYWKDFPENMQKFFEDRVAWKHLQVRRYARFKLDRLGVSPTPRVWVGDDGWLFYNHEAESDNYFSLTDPRLVDRRNQWVTALPEWRTWLAERGIRLQVVVPPNKQSIYSEFLPPIECKRTGPTPLDVFLNQLRQRDLTFPILDLREPVRQAKSQGQLYFQTDTHWNPQGQFVGYQATARALGVEPLPLSAFRITADGVKNGDLPRQMGYWPLGPELFSDMKVANPRAKKLEIGADANDETRLDYLDSRLYVQVDEMLPKVVLFHDSFGFGDFLAEHCSRLLCIPSNHMDPDVIAREKPDVVILEIVERLFQGIGARRPTDPPRRSLSR
jgi:alginate O-acetyltransferase complex protein AlgJ